MYRPRLFLLPVINFFLCLLFLPAAAQQRIPYSIIATGGESANGVYKVYDVIGQPLTGRMTVSNTVHQLGYVPVIKDFLLSSQTAVTITAFAAEVGWGEVRLTWATSGSNEIIGYNVYRSGKADGAFIRLGGGLIPPDAGTAYEDKDVRPGTAYYYRIGAVDGDGESFSSTITIHTPVWTTELRQNRPNPFNPSTTISFYLPVPRRVTLTIYDARGKTVRKLVDGPFVSGEHDILWNGSDDRGESAGSGIYFYRLRAGKETFTRKMTLLK